MEESGIVTKLNYSKYPQAEHAWEVMVPGDPESRHMVMCDTRGGIPYHEKQIEYGVRYTNIF